MFVAEKVLLLLVISLTDQVKYAQACITAAILATQGGQGSCHGFHVMQVTQKQQRHRITSTV